MHQPVYRQDPGHRYFAGVRIGCSVELFRSTGSPEDCQEDLEWVENGQHGQTNPDKQERLKTNQNEQKSTKNGQKGAAMGRNGQQVHNGRRGAEMGIQHKEKGTERA